MAKVISGLLIIAGLIHLLPVPGVLGSERLSALYGLSFQEPNVSILMRHRAVMFGLLGLFLIWSAFRPALQPLAFVAGFVSAVSFVGIAWSVGGYNEAIRKVVIADIVAAVCIVVAVVFYFLRHRQG